MPTPEEIQTQMTAPGAPFEIAAEKVLGVELPVFVRRPPSLRAVLEGSAAHGDAEYLVYLDRRISYAEHLRLVASVAAGLRDRYGVGPGDRVAILAANRPEWAVSFWAATSLGAIAVGLNGWWAGDEIRYGLADSEPSVLIGDRKRLARLAGSDPGVPIVEMESEFAALEAHAPDVGLPSQPIAEDDPALILYTSGTTGRPKGAVLSHRALLAFSQLNMLHGARTRLSQAPPPPGKVQLPPCTLVTNPFFHVSGLFAGVVMMLHVGAKVVLRDGRFDPENVMQLIEREKVTAWSAIGTAAVRVLDHPRIGDFDLSSLDNVGGGGAPLSTEIQEQIRERIPSAAAGVGLGYGLTESGALVSVNFGEGMLKHPQSSGAPLPTVEVEIRGPDGEVLPEGREGEIYVRSPLVMLEYWRNPEASAESLDADRWLRTGDVGRLEEGRLFINSRARDLILRGAENVYPAEIEMRPEAHPDVSEAAVVGVDHRELGQEVKAIVVPEGGAPLDENALAAWVGEALAAFKVPSLWEWRSEPLPRNATGKVLKHVLAGQAENTFVEE